MVNIVANFGGDMLIAAITTKPAGCVTIFTDLKVLLGALFFILPCSAWHTDMLLSAVLTKLAISCLKVFTETCSNFVFSFIFFRNMNFR